jgi:hypothetical protein
MMNITGGTFLYLPEFDYLFSHRFVFSTNVNTIVCVNPTSLVRTLPTQSGTPPNTLESPVTGAGGGGCWCPDYPTGPAFVYYSGGPDKTEYPTTSVPFPFHDLTVWVAQPMLSDGVTYTGDPTGNWHWTKVAMQLTTAGDYPHAQDWRASDAATYGPYISQDGVGHEKRFVYCRPLKAFLWFPDVRSPFSIFKVF